MLICSCEINQHSNKLRNHLIYANVRSEQQLKDPLWVVRSKISHEIILTGETLREISRRFDGDPKLCPARCYVAQTNGNSQPISKDRADIDMVKLPVVHQSWIFH